MTTPDRPRNGDVPSFLEAKQDRPSATSLPTAQPRQTLQQVLVDGEEPTEEFLEELHALESAPELSDEELARQALEAPGADDDPRTPE